MSSKAELEKMSLSELRNAAKKAGVNVAGKRQADLVRALLKSDKIAQGKGTPADPKAAVKARAKGGKAARSQKEAPELVEKTVKPRPRKEEGASKEEPDALSGVIATLKALKGDVASLKKQLTVLAAEVASLTQEEEPDEEEEVADDDEEEDDEEDDEEAEDDADDDDEEDDDEEEDAPEDEDTLEVTEEELDAAGLSKLKEIAAKINAGKGEALIDTSTKNAKTLREAIKAVLNEIAEADEDEEDDGEEADEEVEIPGWIKEGLDVEMNTGDDEWVKGTITSIDEGTVTVEDAESEEYEVEDFDDIRPVRARRGKAR